ncbi:MAG: C4-type zinc ribbon domain-containing protein [Candidatus Omnitrophica bacterium]|nr:C4-type zinc ribbon domain-containing protein [Candidatus Omnitrophota bacterium]MDD5553615.1 C4-type zinc ribbon domain-containing protein [Candidatus Omnitrophota bacterium]
MTNLKSQIFELGRLQTIDSEIYSLKNEKESKPAQIQAIDAAFEEKKKRLAELEAASLNFQKQRKERELELASKEESTKKLEGQLFSLKTNKEYQAMLQQIQDSKADASVIEDQILALFDQADKAKSEVIKEKERLQGEEKTALEQKKRIEDRVKEIDDRVAQLDAQRAQIIPGIDKKVLSQYERILANRDGLAIVKVEGDSCGGCNMFVPPQVINLIRMYERIITCEICNRILYVENHEGA